MRSKEKIFTKFIFDNYYANIFSIFHFYNNKIGFIFAFIYNRKMFSETIKNIIIEKGGINYLS